MGSPSFGDVVRMIEIANQIYTYGFTQSHNAPVLYEEFGENISHLALNLGDLRKVIEFIRRDGMPQALDSVYFDSLGDIIGNYQKTLQDCDKLLRDKTKFKWRGDFIHNIIWNLTVASDVQGLKDRLAYLNIKLLTMLNTLDLGMAQQLSISMNRIHRDLASRIDSARDDIIQHITALGLGIQAGRTDHINASGSISAVQAGPFDIPNSLEVLFKKQIQEIITDSDEFPLVLGLDAVVYHINEANKIPTDSKERKKERQWVEVAKAFWILVQVKSGQETTMAGMSGSRLLHSGKKILDVITNEAYIGRYDLACSFRPSNNFEKQMNKLGITIPSYVKGLESELVSVTKASNLNNLAPDPQVILDVFHKNPDMWLHSQEEIAPTPSWELEFSEKIMSAALKGPYRGFSQSLHLFRLTNVDLKLVISDVRVTNGVPGERNNNNINVDLERSRFIPLYATSTSSPSALNVNFQGDRLAAGSTALSFKKRSDLLKLQQAVTGYQVVFQAFNIKVVPYLSGLFSGPKREYTGRLQLWRAKHLRNSIEGASSSCASSASPNSVGASQDSSANGTSITKQFSGASAFEGSILDRRDSAITMTSKFSFDRRASTATTSSIFSTATAGLRSPPSTFNTSIVDKEGNIGIVLGKPEPSMLVLYLEQSKRSSAPKQLSFLAIQLDEEVLIDTAACDCRNDTACLRSVIQRHDGKPLLTYRHDAGSDLDAWNLAKLGQWQRKSLPSNGERMTWVAVDFDNTHDKDKFGTMFGQLKTIFMKQQGSYHKDLTSLRA